MDKKIIKSKILTDYEVLTDSGWIDIEAIHKTIKYEIFHLKTDKYELLCADNHIVFKDGKEIFIKDLIPGDHIESFIGPTEVKEIIKTGKIDNMYDLELSNDSDKRYFTNGILSHNTTYIRYLAHKLKKNIIFISPDMVNHITDPSFIPFLIKNSDAVLIIEDGEPAIGKRGTTGRTGAVSNMLNLTDGLLSDCLNISIVVTLNTNEKDIDEALLRKGRLLKSYKFEKLSVEKSNKLLK
ncbi:hypothetical protein KY334_04585, partial [Candidatus Woesearchaeota archaeon]|nr:hypothetical protein [Candidatus Woesearchaeota archaeon]